MDLPLGAGDRADEQRGGAALRHAMLWRKSSGGTESEWGSRFVERVLSVAATCRQQGRNVLEYLTGCFRAHVTGGPLPSLLVSNPGIDIY